MKTVSLTNYTKKQLNNYVKTYKDGTLRFNFLLNKAKNDERLAELAKTYFLLLENYVRAKAFDPYFKTNYVTKKELLSSDNKYVRQYKTKVTAKNKLKETLRKELLDVFNEYQVTLYYVSKVLKTSQSNVSLFFKKKQYNKLSLTSLFLLQNNLFKGQF